MFEKIKPFYFLILFIVIAGIFFALGRLSAIEERHEPIRILAPASDQTANAISAVVGAGGVSSGAGSPPDTGGNSSGAILAGTSAVGATATSAGGTVIASKNGSKYYFPWCGGVKLIKPENQVTFASADLARAAGYTPAANCKGLK